MQCGLYCTDEILVLLIFFYGGRGPLKFEIYICFFKAIKNKNENSFLSAIVIEMILLCHFWWDTHLNK